jgi:hypothetical protein
MARLCSLKSCEHCRRVASRGGAVHLRARAAAEARRSGRAAPGLGRSGRSGRSARPDRGRARGRRPARGGWDPGPRPLIFFCTLHSNPLSPARSRTPPRSPPHRDAWAPAALRSRPGRSRSMPGRQRRRPGRAPRAAPAPRGAAAPLPRRERALPTLLPLLLALLAAARGAAGFHDGDFIHTSRRSQYQQVRQCRRRGCGSGGAAGAARRLGRCAARATTPAAAPRPPAFPPTRHPAPPAPRQLRTNWRDLTEHHCPRFGLQRTVGRRRVVGAGALFGGWARARAAAAGLLRSTTARASGRSARWAPAAGGRRARACRRLGRGCQAQGRRRRAAPGLTRLPRLPLPSPFPTGRAARARAARRQGRRQGLPHTAVL